MDSFENHEERPAPTGAGSADASGSQNLDDAALDLVLAATTDGHDGVVRTLLRTLVALGLTSAATYWQKVEGPGPASESAWNQYRGFGGPTPPPDLDPAGGSAPTSEASMSFWFGTQGAIVTLRETFDRDGQREQREDELESLVLLAGTLTGNSHDYPSSHTGETEGEHSTPGPLPGQLPGNGKGRQAG